MHMNEQIYHVAYIVPLVCFLFCAFYGGKDIEQEIKKRII